MRFFKYLGRLLRDVTAFAWQNKAWWMIPTMLMLLFLMFLVSLGQGSISAALYTLF